MSDSKQEPKMVNVHIRVDSKVKKQSEELFDELGLNTSTAINIFLRQAILVGGLPFEVTKFPSSNEKPAE